MEERKIVHGINICDVKEIGRFTFELHYAEDTDKEKPWSKCGFEITYKNDLKDRFVIIDSASTSTEEAREIYQDLKIAFKEHNNIPEIYTLENEMFAYINGERHAFGCRCIGDMSDRHVCLTNKEIDELRKEFRIRDEGWRHLCLIVAVEIEGNKVKGGKISKRYLDQLEYMGFDVSKLEYELKDE